MTAESDSSDLSSLSSLSPVPSGDEADDVAPSDDAAPSDDVAPSPTVAKPGLLKFFSKQPSVPSRKRSPSPPHEYVLADNPDIAFIVMFRSRFSDAFPKSLAHFGPQELERDISDPVPGDRVEHFLCALLGLLLNRKQDVKPGHYGRALEDAVASHKNQWLPVWEDKSPLAGSTTFNSMSPTQRLTLLRALILWSMGSSEAVKGLLSQSYKQNRIEDDHNQPRSVRPWGSDGDKRRYFLIEGQDDTNFRVYRESNPAGLSRTWWSVAGSIDELRALADKLEHKDGGPKAKELSQKIISAIPRFEAGEEKRKRREYRQLRKDQLKRPDPGYSLYEGRTRGKRMKYTFSDEDDTLNSDSTTNRRSARTTGANTPAETGPVTTSSGRQVKVPPRLNMDVGASAPASVQGDVSEHDGEGSAAPRGRPKRSAAAKLVANGWGGAGPYGDTDDDASEVEFGDDEDDVDAHITEESEDDDEFDDDEIIVDEEAEIPPRTLVVKLSLATPKLKTALAPASPLQKAAVKAEAPPPPPAPVRDTISASSEAMASAKTVDKPESTNPASEQPNSATSLAVRASSEQIVTK
ncbi:hypothetical protein L249_8448 [Ophiocordyceps polyrhachis-furcata BCC 54312]|uniref:WHIM1 domain-containing protein n=1 Tax=Ophiocordyceps polyrhachis-furcata BCC 54312 TaxID=1330021 RepID=A0A367L7A4_9HYPO|nr:hypothetical protein L249_8448 [Ophiocordyceps polyrhachis-furcata BCC 54312]